MIRVEGQQFNYAGSPFVIFFREIQFISILSRVVDGFNVYFSLLHGIDFSKNPFFDQHEHDLFSEQVTWCRTGLGKFR